MEYRASLSSALALGLLLAHASSARADELVEIPTTVRVHISSPKPVQLETRPAGQTGWVTACESPCDRDLPLADEYRIAYAREGTSRGEVFRLSAMSESVELKVHPTSVAGKVGGGALIGVGAVIAVVSGIGLAVGTYVALDTPSCGAHSNDWCGAGPAFGKATALVSGVGLLLGGGLVVGGVAALEDAKASTTQVPWSGREPVWSGPQASAPKKAGVVVPLSFSF